MNTRRSTSYRSANTAGEAVVVRSGNRALNMRLVVVLIGVVLTARLFYLQIVKHGYYTKLAVAEHQKKFTIPATRGTLYYRDGDGIVPAVLNTTVYTLYADPSEVHNVEGVANTLAQKLALDKNELKKLLAKKNTAYVVLAKRLSKAQVDHLFKDKKQLVGINVTAVPQRVYPEGGLGAQVLGFVNDEGAGQYGVESALNAKLSGTAGVLKAITDVNGVPLSVDDATNVAQAPKNGQDTVLTIDRNIQAKAEEILASGLVKAKATKGSVVVLDPNTGAVKAMANVPSYDPAKYFEVGDDAYQRFQNRVVSDQYEAGSVIKVLTMATGLNEGVINKDSRFNNAGYVQVDDARIKNVEQDVNGTRTMTDILKYSLNTGVVYILSQLGGGGINLQARERLYNYFTEHYGFGSLTGIEQAGESTGSIYGPKTEQGNNVRYSNMAFGQGMGVTMIQAAAAFGSVVNGGNYYKPHIVEGSVNADGSVSNNAPQPDRKGVVSETTSQAIRDMTRTALNEAPAVANLVRKGYNVGGKTGTSQTIDPATGRYTDDKTVGSYLGFGGDEKPRYVIMVRVDDSNIGAGSFTGSAAAGPIFGELSNWLIDYYNIKPM
ncbi:MAG: penicillin-binding protein 2 [Candidatus Saccharimonadales bacterium]